ncbi:MAG: GYD domain-containing protein [Bauldia sp.]
MPFYLFQAAYTDKADAAMIRHPQHREAALRKSCKALGGKMHNFFFSFGKYDAVLLAELPDNKAAAALSISSEAGGGIRMVHTTVLISVADAMEAMKMAQTDKYKPPA